MEEILEKFRKDSEEVMVRPLKMALREPDLERLRHAFISNYLSHESESESHIELVTRIHNLLHRIQISTGEKEKTVLHRFTAAAEIILLVVKEEHWTDELTKICDRYIKDFRRTIGHTPFAEVKLSPQDETSVATFYQKLIEIQKELMDRKRYGD